MKSRATSIYWESDGSSSSSSSSSSSYSVLWVASKQQKGGLASCSSSGGKTKTWGMASRGWVDVDMVLGQPQKTARLNKVLSRAHILGMTATFKSSEVFTRLSRMMAPLPMTITFLGTSSGGGPSDSRNCSSLVADLQPDGSLWSAP